ncbi:hypothetical protein BD413DRAFT_276766 [Trametes elegans]|nr:hypothetical protein BD413DRAFT_276766 [Trametes elegans]
MQLEYPCGRLPLWWSEWRGMVRHCFYSSMIVLERHLAHYSAGHSQWCSSPHSCRILKDWKRHSANTRELAEGQRVKDDNQTFTHCPGQVSELHTASTMQTTPTSVSTTPRATSTGRPSSGSGSGSSFSMNAIVGGIVGACCAAAGAAGFLLWRRRRSRQHSGVSTATDTARTAGHVQNDMSAIEPYMFTMDGRGEPGVCVAGDAAASLTSSISAARWETIASLNGGIRIDRWPGVDDCASPRSVLHLRLCQDARRTAAAHA